MTGSSGADISITDEVVTGKTKNSYGFTGSRLPLDQPLSLIPNKNPSAICSDLNLPTVAQPARLSDDVPSVDVQANKPHRTDSAETPQAMPDLAPVPDSPPSSEMSSNMTSLPPPPRPKKSRGKMIFVPDDSPKVASSSTPSQSRTRGHVSKNTFGSPMDFVTIGTKAAKENGDMDSVSPKD